jgi:type I restriction enzyme S subunit
MNKNQNLELIVQNLFNQYFVNYNFYNENYRISAERTETEIGNIPSNWNVQSIDSICNVTIGKTPPRKEKEWFSQDASDIKWISIKDLGNSGTYIFETSEYLTKKAIQKFNIKIIRENTILLSFKLTIGRLAITTDSMATNEAIAHFNIKDEKTLPGNICIYI